MKGLVERGNFRAGLYVPIIAKGGGGGGGGKMHTAPFDGTFVIYIRTSIVI